MTQKYQVKVSMNQAAVIKTGLVLKQGDFGMQLEIEVLNFDATGTTPQIVFRKAMGAVESTTITVSGNKYIYTFVGTELDTPGKCICDLKLKNSTTQRISTASFAFEVVADTLDGLNEHANSYSDTIGQIWETLQDYSEDSEAWAVGTKGGVPVGSSAAQYQNNAKYYSDLCIEGTGNLANSVEIATAKVNEVSHEFETLKYDNQIDSQYSWERGSISNGADESTTSKRLRTKGYYKVKNTKLFIDNGWFVYVYYYDENYTYRTASSAWTTGSIDLLQDYTYYRIMLRNDDSLMDLVVTDGLHVNTTMIPDFVRVSEENQDDIVKIYNSIDLKRNTEEYIWEVGGIDGGQDISASKRLRTKGYYKNSDSIVTVDADWYIIVYYYNANKTFVKYNGAWITGTLELEKDYPYYRIMLRNTDSNMDMNVGYGSHVAGTYYYNINILLNTHTEQLNRDSVLLDGKLTIDYVWEVGTITDGEDSSTSKRLRTKGFYNTKNTKLYVDNDWFVYIFYYNNAKEFQVSEGWLDGTIVIKETYPFYRITMRNTNSSMDMLVEYGSHVTGKYYTDTYLLAEEYTDNEKAPSYLSETINTAIGKAIDNIGDPSLIFLWVTDSHYNPTKESNMRVWRNTVLAMKSIMEQIPARFIIHTGDFVDQNYYRDGADNAEVFRAISKSIRDLYDIDSRLLLANGNHDGVEANGYGNTQWYYCANGSINNGYAIKENVPNAYSYKDFPDLKIRILTMSMPDSNQLNAYYWGFSHEQIQWLINTALDVEDSWKIIMTVHSPLYGKHQGDSYGHADVVNGIINAFHNHTTYSGSYNDGTQTQYVNVDYTSFTDTSVVACFAGHTHGDAVVGPGETINGNENELPCPVIVSGAAWFDAQGETGYYKPNRVYNTGTEILFNVVCYYPESELIKVIRVGAGNDMEIDLSE